MASCLSMAVSSKNIIISCSYKHVACIFRVVRTFLVFSCGDPGVQQRNCHAVCAYLVEGLFVIPDEDENAVTEQVQNIR